jgi:hypothetical protein
LTVFGSSSAVLNLVANTSQHCELQMARALNGDDGISNIKSIANQLKKKTMSA